MTTTRAVIEYRRRRVPMTMTTEKNRRAAKLATAKQKTVTRRRRGRRSASSGMRMTRYFPMPSPRSGTWPSRTGTCWRRAPRRSPPTSEHIKSINAPLSLDSPLLTWASSPRPSASSVSPRCQSSATSSGSSTSPPRDLRSTFTLSPSGTRYGKRHVRNASRPNWPRGGRTPSRSRPSRGPPSVCGNRRNGGPRPSPRDGIRTKRGDGSREYLTSGTSSPRRNGSTRN
mmetsp:Transcript_4951/g.14159  ORF Transcript_4951/g.14159 Transcript_4951/m.14159 type:complete len:228 (+) Transcript_4951:1829-2512(+)